VEEAAVAAGELSAVLASKGNLPYESYRVGGLDRLGLLLNEDLLRFDI
jgi:hypothetical protein